MSAQTIALERTVHAAVRGDELAWQALVHQFTPMLRRVAKGFRLAPHDIDDVVQSCWLALYESLGQLREPAAVGAWLATAARRQSLRARQGEIREVLTDEWVAADRPASDCIEESLLHAERVSVFHEAVGRLPARQRAVLEALLAAPDGSYTDVAHQLAMPVGSIGPTRERGLSRLRCDERLAGVVAS
jgi:RNA polymerase sigma factor (sigma-70 family)